MREAAKPPAVVALLSEAGGCARQLAAGFEEEGVPLLVETAAGPPDELARRAAMRSSLGAGIGGDGEMLALVLAASSGGPYLTAPAGEARGFGQAAARLVARRPLRLPAGRVGGVRSSGVHHVDLVVSDLPRSLRFYREVFGPLGWRGVSEAPGERGETIHYLYGPGSSIGLRQAPRPDAGLPVDRYRIGLHHVCFETDSLEGLEATAARLRALNATITDGPREFPEYRPGYHAVFFLDPDGIKLELVWTPPGTYDYQRAGD